MKEIGNYQILRQIAKGGMGEVWLAYDPVCEREVALKCIRSDLKKHEGMKNRFLREARLTAKLTHPGVISIYVIHKEDEQLYYTMPYVEGNTLKQILRSDPIPSILSLLPIFRSICQTIAYAHSKGIIHRDVKPENILVGKYGEVILLDWGLAQFTEEGESELFTDLQEEETELTLPGKIVGTLSYMAPERALGAAANIQSDIYALGVMLYLILTSHHPFKRKALKEFRKNHSKERLLDPEEAAPYRDVPPQLARIAKKCLEADPKNRYSSMQEILYAIDSFMDGRSEWYEVARLDINKKKNWEFQENVLISKHTAITRTTEEAEWVSIMLSRASFGDKTRIETQLFIGEKGSGIAFLLGAPESSERRHPLDGYCLWLGSEDLPFSQLFRNSVEVMHLSDLYLKRNHWHTVEIEKIDNHIHLILDGVRRFTYLSYFPLVGTHVGILSRDADFKMKEIIVSTGSQNLKVSCLAIPDAFLANKDFKKALPEYRRIAYSFPGHAEGREALFRAGITLLEQAKASKTAAKAQGFFTLALEEFEKLHRTPGAPLEYLGKSLVYQATQDSEEEIKCLELALRRYRTHPLIPLVKEQILYRMQESSQKERRSAYQFILLALRHLTGDVKNIDSQRLFRHLILHWESLPFLESPIDPSSLAKEKSKRNAKIDEMNFALPLAFWLATSYVYFELFEDLLNLEPIDCSFAGNLLYSACELGSFPLMEKWMEQLQPLTLSSDDSSVELKEVLFLLHPIVTAHRKSIRAGFEEFFALKRPDIGLRELRTLSYLFDLALKEDREDLVHLYSTKILDTPLSLEDRIAVDAFRIWAYLKQTCFDEAGKIFENYSYELLNQESTVLHPLYGCWLYATEGEEIAKIHFAGVIDTPFPRSWALLGHELTNKISENTTWFRNSFMWERRRLYGQLILYYQCSENPEKESLYRELEKKEYLYVSE